MKVGIIGCGLIGKKRALSLPQEWIQVLCDKNEENAQKLQQSFPLAEILTDWKTVVARPDLELILVCTSNNLLTPIAFEALKNRKHVLIEKPGARSASEFKKLLDLSLDSDYQLKIGFNHRYHPAMQKAKELLPQIGELMFLRGRYGHGGRLGYDKEWRFDSEISGGGELIDQGVHLIDLARWYLGDLEHHMGLTQTYFWDTKVDDNAFLALRTKQNQMAWLHVSCTEWKNMFSLEIYGREAKISIDGLGRSYGREKLTFYQMLPEMGPPKTEVFEFPEEDYSWKNEMDDFIQAIQEKKPVEGNAQDCYEVLRIVEKVYQENQNDYYQKSP